MPTKTRHQADDEHHPETSTSCRVRDFYQGDFLLATTPTALPHSTPNLGFCGKSGGGHVTTPARTRGADRTSVRPVASVRPSFARNRATLRLASQRVTSMRYLATDSLDRWIKAIGRSWGDGRLRSKRRSSSAARKFPVKTLERSGKDRFQVDRERKRGRMLEVD